VARARRLAAIMFTDMVGFTASTQTDEAAALKRLREQERIVRSILLLYRGREIKSTGDGFLVEFDSALRATECAIAIQRRMHERNSRSSGAPIELRIGVHLGDVERRKGDIFGDAVNVASRIGPCAMPGGVCISGPVFDQIQNKIPDPVEKLERTTLKGLQSAVDVYRVALPWEVSRPARAIPVPPRLAVLPLTNISPDPKDEYFADGLTEELIGTLSKIRELRVIARTSVGQYRGSSKTLAQIGSELGVTSVLEGSVRKAGNRLRIALQLIDVNTQEHIWANTYDRDLIDVFAVQGEIAEKTASALRLQLLGAERESIGKQPTADLTAYHLYLKGSHIARAGEHENLEKSMHFFEEAVRADPSFAEAQARLANVLLALAGEGLPAREAFRRARQLADKALALDPNSSEAHTARGNLALQADVDWQTAEAEFRRALSLNPSNTAAHHWYGHLLMSLKRNSEALRESTAVVELDPLADQAQNELRYAQFLTGNLDAAIASAEKARDVSPQDLRYHIELGLFYIEAGRMADAQKEADLSSGDVGMWHAWRRAVLWARVGKTEEARRWLTEMEEASRTRFTSGHWVASVYAALGEKEKAFEWLGRDYEDGFRSLWLSYHLRDFDSIRDDPRFRSMLERLRIPSDTTRDPRTETAS
jgi:adenylate cyclase